MHVVYTFSVYQVLRCTFFAFLSFSQLEQSRGKFLNQSLIHEADDKQLVAYIHI